jgi:hypothetical protein
MVLIDNHLNYRNYFKKLNFISLPIHFIFYYILYFRLLLSTKMDTDKPFACDLCGKSFKTKFNITEEFIQMKNRLNVKFVKRHSVRVLP